MAFESTSRAWQRTFRARKEVAVPIDGSSFAYVACEYNTVKILRQYFREELNWTNKQFYAFSYWKAGDAEDQSATERRREKAD